MRIISRERGVLVLWCILGYLWEMDFFLRRKAHHSELNKWETKVIRRLSVHSSNKLGRKKKFSSALIFGLIFPSYGGTAQ